ncbi:MAG: HYR domain-containing protein, partial [Saprospiraceae bacterium]|nr:HYR domain-containing protein [Saprospiraceae bacterium]
MVKVWEDAAATNPLTAADLNYEVDCGDVGSTFSVWVTREVNLPPPGGPGRSAALPFTILVADCTPPSITCPAPETLTCAAELLPAPPTPMTLAQYQALGGVASDNCAVTEVSYTDNVSSFLCLNKFVVTRTFTAVDPSGNTSSCTQVITVSDNVAPTFTVDPSNLTLDCPDITSPLYGLEVLAIQLQIQNWLNNAGGAAVSDNCGGVFIPGNNLVACLIFDPIAGCLSSTPVFGSTVWDQFPDECSPGPREVQVAFFAKDECGNQAYRVAKVILRDDEDPSFAPFVFAIPNLPSLFGFYTCADLVPGPNPDGIRPYVDDNCSPQEDLVIAWVEDVPMTVDGCNTGLNVDVIARRYRVTDCAGNSRIFTQNIRVRDNVDPNWTNDPNNLELECDANLSTEIAAWLASNGGDGVVTDNCNGVTVTHPTVAAIIAAIPAWCPGNTPYRFTNVTFTATDGCGNTSTRTARVRLRDFDPPTGTAPANITVDCNVPLPDITAITDEADDCSLSNVTVAHVGTTTIFNGNGCPGDETILLRTYSLTDCAGNSRAVTQMITISDRTAPVWAGTPNDLNLNCTQSNAVKNAAIDLWLATRGGTSAADACSAVTYTTNPMNRDNILDALGACAPLAGTVVVTFIASDACGNTAIKTARLTITDNTNPTASNPAPSNVNCLSEVPDPNPNVVTDEADSCSPAGTVEVMYMPGATTNNGGTGCPGNPLVISRRYRVTDCSGNSITVTHTITVLDNVEPNADCKGVTAYLNADGQVTINASQFNDGSADNCGGTLSYEFARDIALDEIEAVFGPYTETKTFDCDDIRPNIENCAANTNNTELIAIRLRVMDACGNTSGFCTTALTLIDNTVPTIDCPDDMTFMMSDRPEYDCSVNATWPHPDVDDNCDIYCYEMEVQKEINGVFVTINPETGAPTPFHRVNVLGVAEASYLFEKGPYCNAGQIDDQYKIIYYVRDEHGNNAAACDFIITVKDDEAPVFTYCPSDPINAQTVTGDCYQMKCWAPPTFYDNCQFPYSGEGSGYCPIPTLTVTTSNPTVMVDTIGDDHCALFPVGTTYVYYTVEDICGNKATCTVTVNITDPEAPVAMCAGPFTVNMEPDGVMQLSVADIDAPGTSDNCGICAKEIKRATSAYGPTVTLTCADVGTTVAVTMRVKDCSAPIANEATCVAMVTVQDMQLPGNAYCPADIEKGTDAGICGAVVTYNPPTFNDGCGSAHLGTLIGGLASGSVFPIGNTTVSYSYTSLSGYTVYCNFVVTVVDDENPTIVCPANVTNLTCLEVLPAPLSAGAFTGGTLTDNCGVTALESSDYDNGLSHCPYDGIRTIIRTYVAFDAAGNSSTCSQTFQYVEDTEPPVLSVKPLR